MKLLLRYNLKYLLRRPRQSLGTAVSVALAVFLTIVMVAMTHGMIATTGQTGSDHNVLVLSRGAESMEFSAVDPDVFHRLRSLERVGERDGTPLASPEVMLSAYVDLEVGEQRRGVVRGVWPVAFDVHEGVRIVDGSPPEEAFEVVVGVLAATKLGVPVDEVAIGRSIRFEGQSWKITGIFEAPGTTLESEIWASLDDLSAVTRRTDYSAVVLRGESAKDARDLVFDLAMRTDVRVEPYLESDYYAARANALRPLQTVSVVMTIMLVLGAFLAAMNTLSAAAASRRRQMAVLMVLGFSRRVVLLSFWLESLLVAILAGVVGCVAGLAIDGFAMSIPMGVFRFVVEPSSLGLGIGLAVLIATLGALLPLWKLAHLSPVEGMGQNRR